MRLKVDGQRFRVLVAGSGEGCGEGCCEGCGEGPDAKATTRGDLFAGKLTPRQPYYGIGLDMARAAGRIRLLV